MIKTYSFYFITQSSILPYVNAFSALILLGIRFLHLACSGNAEYTRKVGAMLIKHGTPKEREKERPLTRDLYTVLAP
jgi:hypothetical protein